MDAGKIDYLLGLLFASIGIKVTAASALSVLEILRIILKPVWWLWQQNSLYSGDRQWQDMSLHLEALMGSSGILISWQAKRYNLDKKG
jgi:hypothetical protein